MPIKWHAQSVHGHLPCCLACSEGALTALLPCCPAASRAGPKTLVPALKKMPTKRGVHLHNLTDDSLAFTLAFDNAPGARLLQSTCRQSGTEAAAMYALQRQGLRPHWLMLRS